VLRGHDQSGDGGEINAEVLKIDDFRPTAVVDGFLMARTRRAA
jgi:hypothetical protein